jgi:glycosyltransferase involved in cell wall biosynthesis
LGLLTGKLAGVPHIVWGIRCSDMDFSRYRPLTRWVVWLCARLSRLATIIIVNSEAGKKVHQAWGYNTSKMVVIPNGFDLDRFKPDAAARRSVRVELGVAEDTLLIGLIARFDPMKDHNTFFKAAGLLARCRPDVCFLLAGAGIAQDNIAVREMISDNCLEGFVQLLGPREDIPRLTAALDIACLSSTGEAFPNVVGEAMACGVPCVVTDVGDAAYIVADTGRVVPARNPEAMSAAWAELIEMGPAGRHALGQKARRRIEENFTLAKMVRAYELLYGRIADGVRSQAAHSLAN